MTPRTLPSTDVLPVVVRLRQELANTCDHMDALRDRVEFHTELYDALKDFAEVLRWKLERLTATEQLYPTEANDPLDCGIAGCWHYTEADALACYQRTVEAGCAHHTDDSLWQEQPGEPPLDICTTCGAIRE